MKQTETTANHTHAHTCTNSEDAATFQSIKLLCIDAA